MEKELLTELKAGETTRRYHLLVRVHGISHHEIKATARDLALMSAREILKNYPPEEVEWAVLIEESYRMDLLASR